MMRFGNSPLRRDPHRPLLHGRPAFRYDRGAGAPAHPDAEHRSPHRARHDIYPRPHPLRYVGRRLYAQPGHAAHGTNPVSYRWGRRSEAYAYLFDIFPTLCDLTGTDIPVTVEGKSLRPAMANGEDTLRDTLFFAFIDAQRAVKNRRFKLIEYAVRGHDRQTQLFDLSHDPWETNNLAKDPGHRDTLAALRCELTRLRDMWDDSASPWGERFWTRLAGESWANPADPSTH